MAEEKTKGNLKIHLSGKKYIISDGNNMYIAQETKSQKSGEPYYKRLSGYHVDLEHLFDSYLRKQVLGADIEGEIEDLVKLIKKTKTEISRWAKKFDKAMGE